MIDLRRLQRCRFTRALALWLVAAQLVLFTATGMLHVHATPNGAAGVSARAVVPVTDGDDGARIVSPNGARSDRPSGCVLCQMARVAVPSIEMALRVTPLPIARTATPVWFPIVLPSYLASPCSTRGPPTF